jgi:hypothetical protein
MAQTFKNKIFTIDTTGSNVDAVTCPAGKTMLIRNLMIFNDNASTTNQTLYFVDNSQSSSTANLWGDTYSISAGASSAFAYRWVLEESDKIQIQTDVNAQRYCLNYVELDNATGTQYKMTSIRSTTEDSYVLLLTVSTGHTMIIKHIALKNLSGNDATANLRIVEATTNTYVPIVSGTLEDDTVSGDSEFDYYFSNRTIVLEAGDSLQLQMSEQPWTSTIHFMEIPVPQIRGQ